MHNVHPSFVNLSVEISELKDEKARMHHVYPWSHLGVLPGWLECFLGSWSLFLACWIFFCFLAGWSLFLVGWSFFPGWLESLPGWLQSLSGWLESFPCWLEFSLAGWRFLLYFLPEFSVWIWLELLLQFDTHSRVLQQTGKRKPNKSCRVFSTLPRNSSSCSSKLGTEFPRSEKRHLRCNEIFLSHAARPASLSSNNLGLPLKKRRRGFRTQHWACCHKGTVTPGTLFRYTILSNDSWYCSKSVWEYTVCSSLSFPSRTLLSTLLDDITIDVLNSIQIQTSYVEHLPMKHCRTATSTKVFALLSFPWSLSLCRNQFQ